MLRGNLKHTPYHVHLIEMMEEDLAEQAGDSEEEMYVPGTDAKKKKRKYKKRSTKPEGIPAEELLGLTPSKKKSKTTEECSPEHFDAGGYEPIVKEEIEDELEPPLFPDIAVKTVGFFCAQ